MKRAHPSDPPEFLLRRSVGKPSKPAPKVTQPEASTLSDVRAFCDDERIEHFHIPGWLLSVFGKLAFVVAQALEHARDSAEEVRGFPDLILFYRGRFLAIELKTEIGKMTHAQLLWQKRLGTLCCRTTNETVRLITDWKAAIDHAAKPSPLPDTSPNSQPKGELK